MSTPDEQALPPIDGALPLRSTRSKLIEGTVWLGSARLLTAVGGLLTTALLARILTPSDFGIVAIATATLAVAMSVTQLSLTAALIAREHVDTDHIHSAWTLSVLRAALLFLVLAALAPFIADFYRDARLTWVLIACALTSAVSGIYNPLISIRTKNLSFRPQFVVQTTQRIATFVLSIALALALRDYWALVWGQLLAVVLTAIVSYWIAPYRPTFRLNEARSLVKFSVWLSLGELVNMFGWRFDQLIIGYFLPRAQLGLYFVADNIASVPTREPILPITQTLFPGFANLRGDPARLARAFSLAQATITAVTFPMGFGFAVVSAPLVHLLLGEKWLGAIPILQVLSGLYAFNSLTATMQSLAIASNQPRGLLLRNIRGVLLRAPAVLLGLWYDGLMGIVWARVVCSIIGTVLNMGYAGRLAGISLSAQIKLHWRTFAATIIMLAVTIPLNLVFGGQTEVKWLVAQTASVVAAGAVAYTASIWVLWLVSGKPEGPEAEGARLLRRLARRGATRTKTG